MLHRAGFISGIITPADADKNVFSLSLLGWLRYWCFQYSSFTSCNTRCQNQYGPFSGNTLQAWWTCCSFGTLINCSTCGKARIRWYEYIFLSGHGWNWQIENNHWVYKSQFRVELHVLEEIKFVGNSWRLLDCGLFISKMELHWFPSWSIPPAWLEYRLAGREIHVVVGWEIDALGGRKVHGLSWQEIYWFAWREIHWFAWREILADIVVQLDPLQPVKELAEVGSRGDTDCKSRTTSTKKERILFLLWPEFAPLKHFPFLRPFHHLCPGQCKHLSSPGSFHSLIIFSCHHLRSQLWCSMQGLVQATGFHRHSAASDRRPGGKVSWPELTHPCPGWMGTPASNAVIWLPCQEEFRSWNLTCAAYYLLQ